MKNSKEMADAVFRIRDACLERQAKRKRLVRRIAAAGSAVCMLGLVLVGIRYVHPAQQPLPNTILATEPSSHATQPQEPAGETAAAMTAAPTETQALTEGTAAETAVETEGETAAATEPPAEVSSQEQQDPTEPPATSQTEPGKQPEPTEPPMEDLPPQTSTGANSAQETVQAATSGNTQVEPTPYVQELDLPPTEPGAFPSERLFRRAELGDPPMTYGTTEKPVEPDLIREELGEVKLFSETQEITGKAFRIEGYDPGEAIAVQFEGMTEYYFYLTDTQ